jgi:hypothetical protein
MSIQGTGGLPVVLAPKKWFREKHFVPLLDAAEQVFIIIFCSLFFFFPPSLQEVFLFSSPKLHKGRKGERKGKEKKEKSPKNNTRA